jgi:hypothetical protein
LPGRNFSDHPLAGTEKTLLLRIDSHI